MPNGNVGTPTKVFLDLIQQCRLPPVVISKLGLTFPKTRTNKKYGDVPFDYGGETVEYESADLEETVISGQGHELLNEGELNKSGESKNNKMSENSEIHQSDNDRKKDKDKKSGKRWRSDPETKKRMNERIEEKMMGESDHSEGVWNNTHKMYKNVHIPVYSQTCIKRSHLGQRKVAL